MKGAIEEVRTLSRELKAWGLTAEDAFDKADEEIKTMHEYGIDW